MITDRLEIQNVFVGDAGACKIEYSIGCHKYSATHGSLAEAIVATIPPELSSCVAAYAEALLEQGK